MMNPGIDFESITSTLERTPGIVRSILHGLPDAAIRANEGEGTWNSFDVVGHLIHGEHTDWIPRIKIILKHGQERAFEPFDREGMFHASQGKTLEDLLNDFENLRMKNVQILREMRLTKEDLTREGLHPALGVVNLGQLLATWVVHDLDHLQQIIRVLAKQSRNSVGPWAEYLSILK
jgi:hypothetical protein